MLKQILAKLPRKSSKSDTLDSAGSNSGNNTFNLGSGFQFANSCNVVSARLNVVKRMSSAIFPSSNTTGVEMAEPHASFNDVPNSEKQNLFVSKLNLCCSVYDFSDSDKNCVEKDAKRQILIELVDFVGSGSAKFTEAAIASMCKMCAANLFRDFPSKCRSYSARGETEDEEPMFDPAWSHLQLVYDLLFRFISYSSLDVKVAKKYVDDSFIVKLLDLFDSEDPRERDCLKTILHRVYGKFMVHRPFIRKSVSNIIYRFVFETERHNGIAELLEIFGSVITGFAVPLKEEHKMFLWRSLIPLHKPKSVGMYHQQLTYCISQFVEKEPRLAGTVIKGLLKYWPVTSSQKELMFLSELEELLEKMNIAEFEKIMVPVFRRVGCCLTSYHFQVAERAHFLWNNDQILNLIMQNRQVILPLVFPALQRNTQGHWHHTVFNLTQNVRKMFYEVDEELLLACQGKFEEEDSKSSMAAERRRLTWERLETTAAFQPAVCTVTC
ncbi:Serine/threonine protein like [Actinidia chinensis var. chinensis]|uniref:Serine/threonine protein phosphatase 2A regulatory subunit n=1 Tax=Actinidia chinensis var. chinensis TaxID=1590841 RepID=A0A2R6Q572_ACTCC|nr:Serine/threonine protein like [Actinidia chinensis var. chinensis]